MDSNGGSGESRGYSSPSRTVGSTCRFTPETTIMLLHADDKPLQTLGVRACPDLLLIALCWSSLTVSVCVVAVINVIISARTLRRPRPRRCGSTTRIQRQLQAVRSLTIARQSYSRLVFWTASENVLANCRLLRGFVAARARRLPYTRKLFWGSASTDSRNEFRLI